MTRDGAPHHEPAVTADGTTPPEIPRVLMVNNRYLREGGEEMSTEQDVQLLRDRGHRVDRLEEDNRRVAELGRLRSGLRTIWSREAFSKIRRRLREERFDVVHVQNFFPLLSPAVLVAADRAGVAVVQSLHNYRLFCVNGLCHREGRPCTECLGRNLPLPAITHACYRDSRPGSAAVAAMQVTHRVLDTWSRVDAFVTPSRFSRDLLVEGGIGPERISVRPNFLTPDPGPGPGGDHFLYVGRLSPEKGVQTLLEAWTSADPTPGRLEIVGDGPLAELVRERCLGHPDLEWIGARPHPDAVSRMGFARALIVPSESYETFGRIVIEAFARGTPVLASRRGAVQELVTPGETGDLFDAGDAEDLRRAALDVAQLDLSRMRRRARQEYLDRYGPEQAYRDLMAVYRDARARRSARLP